MGTGREMHSEGNSVYGACRRKPIKDEEWHGPAETEARVTGGEAGEMDWRGQRLWDSRGKREGKLGSPGVIHIPDSQLLLTQNLQVKRENEWRVTTDVLLCIQYIHFPYLVASHLHPCYPLVLFFMGHNARMNGRQQTQNLSVQQGVLFSESMGFLLMGLHSFLGLHQVILQQPVETSYHFYSFLQ